MAVTYTTSAFNDAAVAFPTSGLHLVRVKHTLSAKLDASDADVLKVCKLPKGAAIVPELCSVFPSADAGASANTNVLMKLTDGTTTKTIITADFDGVVRAEAVAADYAALAFFKTSNDDFYVYLQADTDDINTAISLYITVAYTMDTGRYEVTT